MSLRPGASRTMGATKQAAVIARGSFACAWCARPLSEPAQDGGMRDDAATIDHVDGDGYNHDPANLVPACRSCNNYRRWDDLFVTHLLVRGTTPEAAFARVASQTSRPLDMDAGRTLAATWQPERVRRVAGYRKTYRLRRAGLLPPVTDFP